MLPILSSELQILVEGNSLVKGKLMEEVSLQEAHWFIERDNDDDNHNSSNDNSNTNKNNNGNNDNNLSNLTAAEKKELTRGHVCIYIHLPKREPKIWAQVYRDS